MSWNRRTVSHWGWVILAGFVAALPTFSCEDDEGNGGAGAATTSGTGGTTGGSGGVAGGAGGSGASGGDTCTLCRAAAWIDSSSADTLCQDNGPPSSQQAYDDFHACASDRCSSACLTTFYVGQVIPWVSQCHTCVAQHCFDEDWSCYEDHVAVCEDDGSCDLVSEDCTCTDCAEYSLCNEGQCITDGDCSFEDSCTCQDCWGLGADPECLDPEHCHDDDDCFGWVEGCHCADCADEPNCNGWPGTGGAGGAGAAGGAGGGS